MSASGQLDIRSGQVTTARSRDGSLMAGSLTFMGTFLSIVESADEEVHCKWAKLHWDPLGQQWRWSSQQTAWKICVYIAVSLYINGLVQERRNFRALAMVLRLSGTNPSISGNIFSKFLTKGSPKLTCEGKVWGFVVRVQTLIYILQLLQWRMQYHVVVNCFIIAADWN